MSRRLFVLVLVGWLAVSTRGFADDQPAAAVKFFEQHIRPLLASKCVKCHGESKQEGGLRLDSIDAIMDGGDSGPGLVSASSDESLIIEAIKYESFEMPPNGQLTAREIEQVEHWIDAGAVWPASEAPLRDQSNLISDDDRNWWAFVPVSQPDLSADVDDWSRTPIDRFVHDQLSERGMQPAPQADRNTLIRRLYFDLIGVPPTPEQVDAFVNDPRDDAWEQLVDRLLGDPRYGEHWARFWLDLVRYAESDGWNQDAYRTSIWRYRDYVVNAFNNDKPYPDFVREQLAGDTLPDRTPDDLAAAGFLRLGIYEYNQRDARSHWDDIMNEITDTVGDAFLGMSMACARCHDHKFDPILQRDYYSLRAFFEPIVWRDDLEYATAEQKRAYAEKVADWESASAEIEAQIDQLLKPYHDRKWVSTVDKFPLDIQACFHKPQDQRTSWDEQMAYLVSRQFEEEGGGPLKKIKDEDQERYEALQQELKQYDSLKPDPLPGVMTVSDFSGPVSPTLIPGVPGQQPIEPGFLTAMTSADQPSSSYGESVSSDGSMSDSRRLRLSNWIGSADNPLTMRVIVNRIWQQHFDRGIVATPNDFGRKGQVPTHPALLDWLTAKFIDDGFSIKSLHKRIVMSAVWKQSSSHPDADRHQQLDPAEELLWRAPIRRLKAEQIRDAMLQCSGELDPAIGGPSVDAELPRRALYVKSFRNTPVEFLHAFDAAPGLKSLADRTSTTTPTQALLMINGTYVIERSVQAAERLLARDQSAANTLHDAFRLCWGRLPTTAEFEFAAEFVGLPADGSETELSSEQLADFCHVLFNSNEFLYLD